MPCNAARQQEIVFHLTKFVFPVDQVLQLPFLLAASQGSLPTFCLFSRPNFTNVHSRASSISRALFWHSHVADAPPSSFLLVMQSVPLSDRRSDENKEWHYQTRCWRADSCKGQPLCEYRTHLQKATILSLDQTGITLGSYTLR